MTESLAPQLPPLSLYVHFPWCERKCPYCDFNSHARGDVLPESEYVDALLRDLDCECSALDAQRPVAVRELQSVFLGGGTPSLLSAQAIERLLQGVRTRLPCASDIEVTLEANPGTIDVANFHGYHAAGINRLSIGVQSFDSAALQRLGRIHDGIQAARAIELAQRVGFTRINVDLMHGLPAQTERDALADLRQALALGVTHLSWYQLTIEPNTQFHRTPPSLPDEDTLAHIEDAGFAELNAQGFDRYEVSAFARPGDAARHNLNYWQFGDYLAIGAGAHGKLSTSVDATPHEGALAVTRYQKSRAPADYLRDQQRRQVQRPSAAVLCFEFMLNALRLRDGVCEALFAARTGLPLRHVEGRLAELRRRGLLAPTHIGATALGYRYLDTLVAEFLPTEDTEQGDRSG